MFYRVILVCAVLACVLAAAHASVSGTVLGPDGKPLAGAQVVFRAYRTGNTTLRVTDQAGVFTLDLDTARTGDGEGLGTICAVAPGFAIGGDILVNKVAFVLKLAPACTLHGGVTDGKGAPVAGASVRVEYVADRAGDTYTRIPVEFAPRFAATSDASGQWAIAGIPAACRVGMLLDDARFARIIFTVDIPPDAPPVVALTAKPGVAVSGRVLAPDGKPAEGVKVSLYPAPQQHADTYGQGATDSNGTYHLDRLLPGAYLLSTNDPQLRWLSPPEHALTVSDSAVASVPDITLQTGALITGSVVDDASGEKLSDVQLIMRNNNTTQNPDVVITMDGRYNYRAAPASYALEIPSLPLGYLKAPAVEVTVRAGETRTVEIRLKKGLTLTGRIVDELGNPVPGAMASLTVANNSFSFTAEQDGHFAIAGLPAGKAEIHSEIGTNDFNLWELAKPVSLDIPAVDPVTVTVLSVLTQPLLGRVVSVQGTPLGGVKVTLHALVILHDAGGDVQHELLTDADGYYRLPAVPTVARLEVVSVEKSGYRVVTAGTLESANRQFTVSDYVLALGAK
jgi:protocatechuate 3,4-dioxygenase beta subunit